MTPSNPFTPADAIKRVPDFGAALADESFPPPPPIWVTSPVAFGEQTSSVWKRSPHIELMERAFLDAINAPGGGRLCICVSVRHGKSMFGSRIFPAWYLGTHPDNRVMLAGHEADFASRHGRAARDLLTYYGPEKFNVRVSPRSEAANRWDLDVREGGMLTLGVGGSPIGRGGNVVIVDDPYRNYADAMNPHVREATWTWFMGTMMTRLEADGTIIVIMARWHPEDLVGMLKRPSRVGGRSSRCLRSAPTRRMICWGGASVRRCGRTAGPSRRSCSARSRSAWSTVRRCGTPSTSRTRGRRSVTSSTRRPGHVIEHPPVCKRWVRSWDIAATKNDGDWTVGLLLGEVAEGADTVGLKRWFIADVVRGRWTADGVRKRMLAVALEGPKGTLIELPQDPGQAGKDQAAQLTSMLAGFRVRSKPVTGPKEVRAAGVSTQQQRGNVWLPQDPSNRGCSRSADR